MLNNHHPPLSSYRPLFLDLWLFTLSLFNFLVLARVFIEAWKWTQLFPWGGHHTWGSAAGRRWTFSHILLTQPFCLFHSNVLFYPLQHPILCLSHAWGLFFVFAHPFVHCCCPPSQSLPCSPHLRAAFCTYPSPHWCLCVNQGPTAGYTAVSHLDWETFGLQRGSLGMMQCRRQALQGSGWTQSLHY